MRLKGCFALGVMAMMLMHFSQAEARNVKGTCLHLVSKIAACEPYDCVHAHPGRGKDQEQVRVQILGKTPEGYCHIKQTITDGSYLECKYTEASRAAWSRIMEFFFKAEVMRPSMEDEQVFSAAYRRECSTSPMEE